MSHVPRTPNRLQATASPYLRQHALNPVDWYPWGAEALDKARREDRPIFLSIGYSACHWCHVMERESFEDEEIAALLNARFVPIKVDREERPDLDEIYMTAVQLLTGQGGWPMSMFLTPDQRPFWGGTYFPPDDRYGRPGFRRILEAIAETWATRRAEVERGASTLTAEIDRMTRVPAGPALLTRQPILAAVAALRRSFDPAHGGFGQAPKFPNSAAIQLLLRESGRQRDPELLQMATATLDAMASGGIFDHLGGGFHRYSTDGEWLVPHFEKMLYDQAELALVYLEAGQVTRNPAYFEVARGVLDYVRRDLTHADGGFFSSEDADSEGEEGLFYVWTPAEVREALGTEEAEAFCRVYDVREGGNFEGRSILHPILPVDPALAMARARLLEVRARRARPFRDEKVLASWNGLMIAAFARSARVLGRAEDRRAAERAAQFLRDRLWSGGRLHRLVLDGVVAQPGFLDDHAYLIAGLVELYEATFDAAWLRWAEELAEVAIRVFLDPDGGFRTAASDGGALITQWKSGQDGSVPSGNSMMAWGLYRLGRLLGRSDLERRAEATLRYYQVHFERAPGAFQRMLLALDLHLGPRQEIVIAGPREDASTGALLAVLEEHLLPRAVRSWTGAGGDLPLHEGKGLAGGKPAVYICRDSTCDAPITSPDALRQTLETLEGE